MTAPCADTTAAFADLEQQLFHWQPDDASGRATRFVRATLAPTRARARAVGLRELPPPMPEAPGSYACAGRETTVVRATQLAIARVGGPRAA
ncbi:MAG: hypothetical protein K1X88_17085 [Nannocystaceae bacterium]|nr:hypothetical protein [Nannocystaceae bacterium]